MSTLQRRRMMMAQGVTYDGIPLTITNVSDSNVVISIKIRGGLAPLLYYKKGDRKTYRKWNYNAIILRPQESLHIFGDNPDGLSKSNTEYINFRSSGNISVSGRVSSLSSTIRNYNYGNLFDSANVVNISEDLFEGVTLTPYCFANLFAANKNLQEVPPYLLPFTTLSTYCYMRMFSNTGLKKVPANFLPATNALNAYVNMFSGSDVSDIEVGAVNATSATYLERMFMYCPLENIKEGAFKTITSYGNGTFTRMFSNCKFYSAPTKLVLMGTSNYVYESLFENNKNLQYVGDDFFNNLNVPKYQNKIFSSAFYGCTSLQSVSIPYGDDKVFDRPRLFINTFKGCTSLNRVEVKFTSWTYIDNKGVEQQITPNWLTNVSPTGTFICPKELAEATDGYYDEEGNFVAGVGRSESTVPKGWTVDFPVIDARGGDANAMALMAVISQQTHADGTPWVKDNLVMMKSEAEKVEDIGTIFANGKCSATNYTCMQYFVNSNFPSFCFQRSKMETIVLPNTLTVIPETAFSHTPLYQINIPDSVVTILGGAFYGTPIKSIDFNKVTKLDGYNHFLGSGLERIYISKTLLSIGDGSFRSCKHLDSIIVEEGHPTYDSRENCNAVIQKSNNSLIVGCNTTIIPDSVKSIGNSAFNSSQISYIDIPASVTSIGWGAFQNCKSLQTVILRKSTRYVISAADFQNVPATFYVPDELLDEYKTADVWSTLADRIKPISELPQ